MKIRRPRLKPASKASSAAHVLLNVALVLLILACIIEPIALPPLAVVLLLLSKWRMFAVKPRHWLTNIKANLVDIGVGLSVIIFMSGTSHFTTQLIWAVLFGIWLLFIKPRSSTGMVMIQAMTAQALTLIALFGTYSSSPILMLVVITWLICYSAARHFFSVFEGTDGRLLAHIWGLFGAELAWVLSHWLLSYGILPQIALLITVVGYSMAVSYYIHIARGGLKDTLRNQFVIVTIVIIVVVALFSQWQYTGLN